MSDVSLFETVDLQGVLEALQRQDLDAAIEAGLMRCPPFDGLITAEVAVEDARLIDSAATQRRVAWAARERFEARNARVEARKLARDNAHRNKRDQADKLPPAANAALLRALERVRKPKV